MLLPILTEQLNGGKTAEKALNKEVLRALGPLRREPTRPLPAAWTKAPPFTLLRGYLHGKHERGGGGGGRLRCPPSTRVLLVGKEEGAQGVPAR